MPRVVLRSNVSFCLTPQCPSDNDLHKYIIKLELIDTFHDLYLVLHGLSRMEFLVPSISLLERLVSLAFLFRLQQIYRRHVELY